MYSNDTTAMIALKPEPQIQITCPQCQSQRSEVKEVLIQSAFVMADCSCSTCGFEFYQTLPVGHTVSDTFSIGKSDGELYPRHSKTIWLSEALLKAHHSPKQDEVPIRKIIYEKQENVVVLNALDYLYGHSLLKLYNSLYHIDHHPDLGLVIIVPKLFEWLIPQGCAEAWVVDLTLQELRYSYPSIQKFMTKEFERFHTIYLSKAYSHPDFTDLDIRRFTGIRPFNLVDFTQGPPTITFVLREDRWWFPGMADYWFYRLCRKFKLVGLGRRILSARQNNLVRKTIKVIRKQLPGANFKIVGLGTTGNFIRHALDERKNNMSASVEKDWCRIYARSHVVVGVHGSNMLLPTAFAAGCVEILPEERYGNMVQDISVRYSDRRQLFFYRFADQYASPKSVARKVVAMIDDYDVYNKNMCSNLYRSGNGLHDLSPLVPDADIYAID